VASPFIFLLLHSAAIRPQEAKKSIDEEEPRQTSSIGVTSLPISYTSYNYLIIGFASP